MKLLLRPDDATLTRLIPRYAGEQFSYPEVGATRRYALPPDYQHLNRTVVLGKDQTLFDRAAEALSTWSMHRQAGLTVATSAERASENVTAVMIFGFTLAGLIIPCRVVWTLNEPNRLGFAYGTVHGHPLRGEEAFIVEHRDDGSVTLSIRAFSTPVDRITRKTTRISRRFQDWVIDRYIRSLTNLACP